MNEKKIPLRFWIGRHEDGSGRQCIVDAEGGPMEGVKSAWNENSPNRLTTFETVVQPELSRGSEQLLGLMFDFERRLGDPSTPWVKKLLEDIAMAAYESGLQQGALRRGK